MRKMVNFQIICIPRFCNAQFLRLAAEFCILDHGHTIYVLLT